MNILISEEVDVPFSFDYVKVCHDVVEESLRQRNFPYEVEISITFTDDKGIHEINKEFRQIDHSTDVLSFPMHNFPAPGDFSELNLEPDYINPDTDELLLGDIVLSVDHILHQAEEYGHSIKREYAFLIAHSMLHLMGFDHMEEDERLQMEKLQNDILDSLKITRD